MMEAAGVETWGDALRSPGTAVAGWQGVSTFGLGLCLTPFHIDFGDVLDLLSNIIRLAAESLRLLHL